MDLGTVGQNSFKLYKNQGKNSTVPYGNPIMICDGYSDWQFLIFEKEQFLFDKFENISLLYISTKETYEGHIFAQISY